MTPGQERGGEHGGGERRDDLALSGPCSCGLNTVCPGRVLVLLIQPLPGTGPAETREAEAAIPAPPPHTHPGSPGHAGTVGCTVGLTEPSPLSTGLTRRGAQPRQKVQSSPPGSLRVLRGSGGAGQSGRCRQDPTQREAAGTRGAGSRSPPFCSPPRLGSPLGLESGSRSVMLAGGKRGPRSCGGLAPAPLLQCPP